MICYKVSSRVTKERIGNSQRRSRLFSASGISVCQKEKSARRLRNGWVRPTKLFSFVEIQKWARYPGGSSCFPCSSVTWQGPDPRFPILSPLPPLRPSLFLCHPPRPNYPPTSLAGKRAQPAMETGWLRRRPGRCTGDKFVFVSWAVTLRSRTLTRSCQREGRREPAAAAALPPRPKPHPPTHPPATQPITAPRGGGKPLGAGAFLCRRTAKAP